MNDKYLTYNALELAQDDAFIRWVKEGGGHSREWEEWLARHPEKQAEVEEARLLVRSITIKEAPASPERIDQLWRKIDAATEEKARPRLKAYRWLGYAAAAALALLLAFFFLRPDGAVTVETGFGQFTQHLLPDGSKVELNAGTSIRYQKDTWADSRLVSLEGEAFFQVEKGSRFVVETPKGTVEVLGTSFNINTFEGRFDVLCYTGRVQVSADGSEEVLTAGQLAQWAANGWQTDNFDVTDSPGWKRGQFEYDNTPLRQVFAEMERQFAVRIEAPDSILARNYSGSFERNSLDSALYRVAWPMELEARQEGEVLVIRPAGSRE